MLIQLIDKTIVIIKTTSIFLTAHLVSSVLYEQTELHDWENPVGEGETPDFLRTMDEAS